MDLTATAWILAGLAALVVGFTKTGITGIGILAVVLMAEAVKARQSVGVLLPMLIVADIFAIAFYRRHASWPHLVRLLPWVAPGLAVGFFALDRIPRVSNAQQRRGDAQQRAPLLGEAGDAALERSNGAPPDGDERDVIFRRVLGGMVLVVLALHLIRTLKGGEFLEKVPRQMWFTAATGLLAGFFTAFANAAGAIMSAYVLSMGFDKRRFMGTIAWYFFIVNLVKVPAFVAMGLIRPDTLVFNAKLVPLIAVGALVGPLFLKVVPQKVFNYAIFTLAAAGAIRLLVW